jgi:hypothetical protein
VFEFFICNLFLFRPSLPSHLGKSVLAFQ